MTPTLTQVISKTDKSTSDTSMHWSPKECLVLFEKVTLYAVLFLVPSFYVFIFWQDWGSGLKPNYFHTLWLAPFFLSIVRLFDWWPFAVGNFIYFRNGQILYRVGFSSLTLKQGTIEIAALESVFVYKRKVVLRGTSHIHAIDLGAIPQQKRIEFKRQLFLRIKAYDHINVSKVVASPVTS